ncbi:indolethylamine N-methyltransferase-like [Anomaloglossus baeobatrachus]|uniref:indolethylamine N-methyltransferase-like n=1 Tax=Anomaloglossus baeobatrachus TaxID=238106 RepID=UPI003F508626
MPNSFTPQHAYTEEFIPRDYLQTSYAAEKGILIGEYTDFVLENLHETFIKGGVRGDTLLDIGTGASIYHLLSACEVFDKIIVSDLNDKNRAEFQKWLKKDSDSFDWTHIIKFVCELEGNRQNSEKKAEKLRNKVKEVLKCDALKPNPFDPVVIPPVDCLLSCLCLEVACKDMKSYCEVLKNFKGLIKPGGHVVIMGTLNASFYHVGKKQFSALTAKTETLETAFQEAGFQIEKAAFAPRVNKSWINVADFGGKYFICARKPK